MEIRPFDLLWDASAAFVLWEKVLGQRYPLDAETFLAHADACLRGRPGGASVAVEGTELVGFSLTERNGESGFLHALLVAPDKQRQGIGLALLRATESQLRDEGCRKLWLGRGPERLWTALPEDLPEAAAFFAAQGFGAESEVCDLAIDLREQPGNLYQDRLAAAGVEVVPCTREMLPEVLAFEQREFAGWMSGILRFAAKGEEENVLVVRNDEEIVGTIQTFPPGSRAAGPNLVWRAAFDDTLGGYGAVGIAKAWRGKGLGIAMCEAAGNRLREQGAVHCFIDWTTIVDFYARVGAKIWRRFTMMGKAL
jgi:GNAT superfamily N-acetyltransferase